MRCVLLLLLTFIALPGSVLADSLVFISIKGEQRIAVYRLDEENGKLTHLADTKTKGEPGNLTCDAARGLLFVAMRSTGELASFRIEPATGKMTLLSQVPGGDDPAYVSLDQTKRFLFTAFYVAAKVTVHAIGDDGKLTLRQSIDTAKNAHAIVADPSNRFVFVPHTGANAIFQFRFDVTTGKLTANEPAKLPTPEKSGPRHLVFLSRLPTLLYVDNEQDSSVTSYTLDTKTGLLNAKATLSTLPAKYKEPNSTAEIKLNPKGNTLYVSNRGHNSIAVYRVGPSGNNFRFLGHTPTEKTPRSFDIDPSGRWLFVAGEGSGKLAGYRIDDKTGELERVSSFEVGPEPWCVLAVKIAPK
jgi:6-phosphogluconolactonase